MDIRIQQAVVDNAYSAKSRNADFEDLLVRGCPMSPVFAETVDPVGQNIWPIVHANLIKDVQTLVELEVSLKDYARFPDGSYQRVFVALAPYFTITGPDGYSLTYNANTKVPGWYWYYGLQDGAVNTVIVPMSFAPPTTGEYVINAHVSVTSSTYYYANNGALLSGPTSQSIEYPKMKATAVVWQ